VIDPEVQRILNLPSFRPISETEAEALSCHLVRPEAREEGFSLRPIQAEAVVAFASYRGLLAPIGVGQGKTLISLLVAHVAMQSPGNVSKALLLVPASLLPQLLLADIPQARQWCDLEYRVHVLSGIPKAKRLELAASGKAGLYVASHDVLSTQDGEQLLEDVCPGLVIVDECHAFARFSAARTKRLARFVRKNQPQFAALSGTITSRSIRDYWHLAKWALGSGSPLPLCSSDVNSLACLLDPDGEWGTREVCQWSPLWERSGQIFAVDAETPDKARAAFRDRLRSAPGVVCSAVDDLGCSLRVENLKIRSPNETVRAMEQRLRTAWTAPDGRELSYILEAHRYFEQLSAGFYYREVPPPTASSEQILLMNERKHFRNQYFSSMRKYLQIHGRKGQDTPALVERLFVVDEDEETRKLTPEQQELLELWQLLHSDRFRDLPEFLRVGTPVDSFKVSAAMALAARLTARGKSVLVWYKHRLVGEWLQSISPSPEAAKFGGFRTAYVEAGQDEDAARVNALALEGKPVLAVISVAHREGKNLQGFHHSVVVEWPRSARAAEQLIGRTHRMGQKADTVHIYSCLQSEWDFAKQAACLADAAYVQETTGVQQKLLFCDFVNPPAKLDPRIAKQYGFDIDKGE
jgi:hypothetical protein